MVTLKGFKNIIKKYKEPFDYLISIEDSKEIYDIRSQELKQVLFAENLKEEIVPSGASCKVEVKGEEVKKFISIADGQIENSSENQVFSVGGSVFNQQSSITNFPNNSLNGPLPIRPTYDKDGNQIIGQDNIRKEVERRRVEWSQWEREGKVSRPFSDIEPLPKSLGLEVLNGPLPIRPTYDKDGNQIIGQDNIRKEVERRRAEWSQQEKEGKLQTERKESYQKVGDTSVYEYIEYTKKT